MTIRGELRRVVAYPDQGPMRYALVILKSRTGKDYVLKTSDQWLASRCERLTRHPRQLVDVTFDGDFQVRLVDERTWTGSPEPEAV